MKIQAKHIKKNVSSKLQKYYTGRFTTWRLRVRQRHKKVALNIVIGFSLLVKRCLDITFSAVGIILMLPLLTIISIAIILEDGMPVFFQQQRVGKHGELFKMFKLRSMKKNAEEILQSIHGKNESKDGVIFKMRDDPRVTKVGRFIRKASIDELPQFFNVFLGDMSLVGPRPALPSEVEQYNLEQRKRLNIKPGITCLWQVEGRSSLSFTQQVQLDVLYMESQSFWLDIRLLLKTIPAVIFARGAY